MILDGIVAHNRLELEKRQAALPLPELRRLALEQPPPLDFAAALLGDRVRLIAEVKRASPSKGTIRPGADPVEIARTYAANGAAAISVLTETKHFQGSLQDLRAIREALDAAEGPPRTIPLLRKDFFFDPYHIYEARAYGADAVLLIVAILPPAQLKELLFLAHQLGLKALVEVHNEAELGAALRTEARIIGINNRNLDTLDVDLNTTRRLRAFIPPDRIVVSESGIRTRTDVEDLRHLRVDAVLVGQALMSEPDIAAKMKELL
jgi:indole-3-glycerol phosphate synthase